MSADLEILNRKYNLNIKQLNFTYGYIEYYAGSNLSLTRYGNNILVGNSGHPSSNHIDTFKILQNNKDVKIIVPLNYGGTNHYINSVNKLGLLYFKEKYNPLINLMPLDVYRNKLLSCKAAFMYHKRQQAVGNIIMLLWMGVKVFVDEQNPVYNFYKKNNILIFSINEFIKSGMPHISPLCQADILYNREKLTRLYSFNTIINETKKLVLDSLS